MKIKPLMVLPPLLFAGLAALFYWGMGRDDPRALPSTREGGPVPALTLTEFQDAPAFSRRRPRRRRRGAGELLGELVRALPGRAPAAGADLAREGIEIYGINYKDDPAQGAAVPRRAWQPLRSPRRRPDRAHRARLGALRRARDLRDRRQRHRGEALRRADHRGVLDKVIQPGDRDGAGADPIERLRRAGLEVSRPWTGRSRTRKSPEEYFRTKEARRWRCRRTSGRGLGARRVPATPPRGCVGARARRRNS